MYQTALPIGAGAQALDMREYTPGKGTLAAKAAVRRRIEFLDEDRPLYTDHNAACEMVRQREVLSAVEEVVGELATY